MVRPSRRQALLGSLAASASLAAGQVAAGASRSAEFIAYREARAAWEQSYDMFPEPKLVAYATKKAWLHAQDAWHAKIEPFREASFRTAAVIRDRPVRSWRDFVELAEVVRTELWQQRPDGTWEAVSGNDELEEALQRATWWLIDGGAHG